MKLRTVGIALGVLSGLVVGSGPTMAQSRWEYRVSGAGTLDFLDPLPPCPSVGCITAGFNAKRDDSGAIMGQVEDLLDRSVAPVPYGFPTEPTLVDLSEIDFEKLKASVKEKFGLEMVLGTHTY